MDKGARRKMMDDIHTEVCASMGNPHEYYRDLVWEGITPAVESLSADLLARFYVELMTTESGWPYRYVEPGQVCNEIVEVIFYSVWEATGYDDSNYGDEIWDGVCNAVDAFTPDLIIDVLEERNALDADGGAGG